MATHQSCKGSGGPEAALLRRRPEKGSPGLLGHINCAGATSEWAAQTILSHISDHHHPSCHLSRTSLFSSFFLSLLSVSLTLRLCSVLQERGNGGLTQTPNPYPLSTGTMEGQAHPTINIPPQCPCAQYRVPHCVTCFRCSINIE